MAREGASAIAILLLIRPFLLKNENIKKTDKILNKCKERPYVPLHQIYEPKYMQAFRLWQDGVPDEEIAKRLKIKPRTVRKYIDIAKNPEGTCERYRRYKRGKAPIIQPYSRNSNFVFKYED